jgi:hypothetical protein
MPNGNEHPQLRSRLGACVTELSWCRLAETIRQQTFKVQSRGDLGLCDMVNSNEDLEGSGPVWNSIGMIVRISSKAEI